MASEAEAAAMRRAVAIAASPDAPLGPNPRVGCVLLRPDGTVLAQGYHRGAGTPHAEVVALRAAGTHARGATAVVTLEPCAHTGRTGPCVTALLDAGVSRVVYGQADTSRVAGGGAAALAAAGVEVEGGLGVPDARSLNPEWTAALERARPFVTWKTATTLDGRVAAVDGTSRWITGPQARADVHAWRARCGAVLVGTGTVLADDPSLTVRDAGRLAPLQPLRAVMGLRDVPADARVRDGSAPTLLLRTRDPRAGLDGLAEAGATHVFLEGGPRLAAAFVEAGLVDRVVAYYAPRLLGSGPSALADIAVATLPDAPSGTLTDVRVVGTDVRVVVEGLRSERGTVPRGAPAVPAEERADVHRVG